MAETTYHAPVYEPTVDELEVLKKLEMGEPVSLESAAREHMSKRLRERGLVEVDSSHQWHITAAGRADPPLRCLRRGAAGDPGFKGFPLIQGLPDLQAA